MRTTSILTATLLALAGVAAQAQSQDGQAVLVAANTSVQSGATGNKTPGLVNATPAKVGDSCTYARRDWSREIDPYTQVVTEVNDGGYVANFLNPQGGVTERSHYTHDGNQTRLEIVSTGAATVYSSPVPRFKYPMEQGSGWTGEYSYNTRNGTAIAKVKVEARTMESISVPAGTFSAMKIVMSGRYDEQTPQGSGSGTINETYWYAPSAGCVVKHERKITNWAGAMNINTVRELLRFVKM